MVVSRAVAKLTETIQETLSGQQILPRLDDLSRRRNQSARFESMLSRSGAMWDLFDLCTRIAPAAATVLIAGETGTGKELLARRSTAVPIEKDVLWQPTARVCHRS